MFGFMYILIELNLQDESKRSIYSRHRFVIVEIKIEIDITIDRR